MSTINECCDFADITETTFRNALKRKVFGKQKSGGYDIKTVVRALIKDRQAAKAGHGDHASAVNLSTERAALAKEQREQIAFKNAVSRGEYVLVAGVEEELRKTVSICREIILSSPGKYAHMCEGRSLPEIEQVWASAAREVLTELAYAGDRL